jgi:phosphoglycolate phosphatase
MSEDNDNSLSCILFDLDGTLADTAPDLIAALNRSIQKYHFSAVEYQHIKPFISHGAVAMIKQCLPDCDDEALQAEILKLMLEDYQQNISQHTQLYQGMEALLNDIENRGLKWGVVTNKRQRFTQPLMAALDLTNRAACIISGDTTNKSKPHPEPMLAACRDAEVKPEQCIYIGDAAHDIEAGKAAGMKTMAATWGYLKSEDMPEQWGADFLIHSPDEILVFLDNRV